MEFDSHLAQKSQAWIKAALFGLLFGTAAVVIRSGALPEVSPFAATALALLAAAIVSVMGNLKNLWLGAAMTNPAFVRAFFSGTLVMFGVFFTLLGIHMGAHPLATALFLTMSPTLSLVGRRVLWGEPLSGLQRAGVLLSVAACGVWLFVDPTLTTQGLAYALQSPRLSVSLPDTLVFLGSFFWSLSLAVTRPSECSSPTGAYGAWVSLFASLVSIPFMAWGQAIVFPLAAQGALSLSQPTFLEEPLALVCFSAFGIIGLSCRYALLNAASQTIPSGLGASCWTTAMILIVGVFIGLQNIPVTGLHFAFLPVHLLGVALARGAFIQWLPYSGPSQLPVLEKVA